MSQVRTHLPTDRGCTFRPWFIASCHIVTMQLQLSDALVNIQDNTATFHAFSTTRFV